MDEARVFALGPARAFGEQLRGLLVGIGIFQPEPGTRRAETFEMLFKLENPAFPRGCNVVDDVGVQKPRVEDGYLGVFERNEFATDKRATI